MAIDINKYIPEEINKIQKVPEFKWYDFLKTKPDIEDALNNRLEALSGIENKVKNERKKALSEYEGKLHEASEGREFAFKYEEFLSSHKENIIDFFENNLA